MKNYIKKMIPAIIIAFSFSFMLFIYEPMTMYLGNTSDFWFDMYTLISGSLIGFCIAFIVIILIYSSLYIIQKLILKKNNNFFNICLIIGLILFIITYIQGNFLSNKLPTLDGKEIVWSSYKIEKIYSIVLLLINLFLVTVLIVKFKFEITVKYLKNISLAICLMLSITLASTCLTAKTGFQHKRYISAATTKHINEYSKNKNLIVLLLDSIDSKTMNEIVKNNKYEYVFNDFTYYPDTVGGYAFTRDNVPLILSGVWSENKQDFASFYNDAMDNSKLLKYLEDKKYNANIYNNEFSYNTAKSKRIKNLTYDNKIDIKKFLKSEIKYDLYKYLPYYLKKYSKIETVNFIYTKKQVKDEMFYWDNVIFINDYLNRNVQFNNSNEFKYIHLEGAHYPFDCDKNFDKKRNGTYEDKIEGSILLIDKYLKYLKKNDIYNNSAIIILADHGFWWDIDDASLLKRHNPILYIKGFNEQHKMMISDKKVSFDNFQDIYNNLLNGVKTDKLFDNIDTSKPRRFLLYRVSDYDHMDEFFQYGKAGNVKSMKKTGKKFNLEKK